MHRVLRALAATAVGAVILVSCSADPDTESDQAAGSASPSPTAGEPEPEESASPSESPSATPSEEPSEEPSEPAAPGPDRFHAGNAVDDVQLLAGRIGPRMATGPAFRRAARMVERRFASYGYDVQQQRFSVPAGDSWGVPVDAGRSSNVIATPPDFDPARRHRIVGAHLDTVAVAPGAEDNASGVAVLLDLARLAARTDPAMPTVFIAYGAEEPRGPGDDMHHFGSQHHVRTMDPEQRRGLREMLSIDRVGVGAVVPVCTGGLSPLTVRNTLLRTAEREDIPAQPCESTASDHWSYEKADFRAARLGSTSYAQYHSAEDLPPVVSQAQLGRTGRLAWAWLTG